LKFFQREAFPAMQNSQPTQKEHDRVIARLRQRGTGREKTTQPQSRDCRPGLHFPKAIVHLTEAGVISTYRRPALATKMGGLFGPPISTGLLLWSIT
jgi:hypothetical protein